MKQSHNPLSKEIDGISERDIVLEQSQQNISRPEKIAVSNYNYFKTDSVCVYNSNYTDKEERMKMKAKLQEPQNEPAVTEASTDIIVSEEEKALAEFINERQDGSISSPSDVVFENGEMAIKDIQRGIEQLVQKKWKRSENSRICEIKNENGGLTLGDIKKALIPYAEKGWTITMSILHKDKLMTYEANHIFLNSNKYENNSFQGKVFLRIYPLPVKKISYINRLIPLSLISLGGLLTLVVLTSVLMILAGFATSPVTLPITTKLLMAFTLLYVIASWTFLPYLFNNKTIVLRKKNKIGKLGPLLWIDRVEGYINKAGHSVTKGDSILAALNKRILTTEDE